ncbi:MAG: transporter substrate-binding domain-containing protein, partial [Lachnospiraceae bacterium]
MKKRLRSIGVLLTVAMLLSGCGGNEQTESPVLEQGQSDLQYVQEKGTLVVGITDYAPMDYQQDEGWTGFDVDLAKAFADSLGVTLQFTEIDWNQKTELLEKGSIDCIWNGMTMTEELQETISCSDPYLSNAQVVVLKRTV